MSSVLPTIGVVCAGCGLEVPHELGADGHPFRCPAARSGDGVDHVLQRRIAPTRAGFAEASTEPNPFVRYRERLHAYALARSHEVSDADFVALVRRLTESIAVSEGRVGHGHAIEATPFRPRVTLGEALAIGPDSVWVKDETGQVAGSHKVRHLFGVLLHLEVLAKIGKGRPRKTPLAIASCGNAALAAAVVARAAERPLDVYVPHSADGRVVEQISALGARVVRCKREVGDPPGDPCYHRFRAAVDSGSIPFSCQGPDNGLAIEGGETIAWEIVDALLEDDARTLAKAKGAFPPAEERSTFVDHVVVQVGGGALASAVAHAFDECVEAGLLAKKPRFHTVQAAGAAPLSRAHQLVRRRARGGEPEEWSSKVELPPERVEAALAHAVLHRNEHMWAWEVVPKSVADGILDDETYDWYAVVAAMMRTNGRSVVVSEDELHEAHTLAVAATGIDASATGTAGLAGLMQLVKHGVVRRGERAAILFTGARR